MISKTKNIANGINISFIFILYYIFYFLNMYNYMIIILLLSPVLGYSSNSFLLYGNPS